MQRGCLAGLSARERERTSEDPRRRLALARLGRADRGVDERVQPGRPQHLVQRDVPIGHDDEAVAGVPQRRQRRGDVSERPEAQRREQGVSQLGALERADVGACALERLAQHLRTAVAQQRQRRRVGGEIVVRAVEGDLPRQCGARLRLADLHAAGLQLRRQARCGTLELDERPERVKRDHHWRYATQCHVAKIPL